MINRKTSSKSTPATGSRRSLIGVVTITLLFIGVVTALSMQPGSGQQPINSSIAEGRTAVAKTERKNLVTLNEAGQPVVLDSSTGKTRGLTQDEARRLAEGLKQLINQSSDGLVQVNNADGSVSIDLEDHFQNVILAKKEDDGSITETCVDNPEAAANFFEIDPKLLGVTRGVSKTKPVQVRLEER